MPSIPSPENSGVLRKCGKGLLLEVIAVPGSGRSEACGTRRGGLLVRLKSPPEGGKANAELSALIAKLLGLRKTDVRLKRGAASRRKSLLLPPEAERALTDFLSAGGFGR